MSNAVCNFCRKSNPSEFCEACYAPLCSGCVNSFNPEMFELSEEPCLIEHTKFCHNCFEQTVAPEIEAYEKYVALAKEVHYWPKSFRGHIPVLNKANYRISVVDAKDEKEALLRLGYKAAKLEFNSIILGTVDYRKERNHGYQKMLWSGEATPANVDIEKVERNEFREQFYRF